MGVGVGAGGWRRGADAASLPRPSAGLLAAGGREGEEDAPLGGVATVLPGEDYLLPLLTPAPTGPGCGWCFLCRGSKSGVPGIVAYASRFEAEFAGGAREEEWAACQRIAAEYARQVQPLLDDVALPPGWDVTHPAWSALDVLRHFYTHVPMVAVDQQSLYMMLKRLMLVVRLNLLRTGPDGIPVPNEMLLEKAVKLSTRMEALQTAVFRMAAPGGGSSRTAR